MNGSPARQGLLNYGKTQLGIVVMAGYIRLDRWCEVDEEEEEEKGTKGQRALKGQAGSLKGASCEEKSVGAWMGGCAVSSTAFGRER